MSKRKSNLGGACSNSGSKSWRQRLVVNDSQRVNANTILVINPRKLRKGKNTYRSKNIIHSSIKGVVKIKNRKVEVINEKM